MSYTTTTFHDFIRTYDKAFFLFISQTGEQYSYSDAYSMYRRHYDVYFPTGSKIFSDSGGYLNYYRVQPNPKMGSYWTIVTLDNVYSEYSSLDNLNVKIWEGEDDNSVTVYTETDEQTNQVGYCINSLTSRCRYRDEKDVKRWLGDFIDRKHTQNPTGVKLDDFCYNYDAGPTVLLNAIDWLNGFEWNDRNNVVVWLNLDYGEFNLHVRDYSVADSNGKDDAQYYVEEIEDYFGDYAEVTFKPYSNGYWGSVPNPSNFSFDRPGFVDIVYKADVSQPLTNSKQSNMTGYEKNADSINIIFNKKKL